MIARMQIRETAWNQLLSDWQTCVDTETCSLPDSVQTILANGQWRKVEDAQNPAGFVLIDTIGSETDIDALYNHFAPGDKIGYGPNNDPWKWWFDGKVNFVTEYTGQHDDILSTQPAGSSFENPKWTHGWAGQGKQRFAREHSREFGEEFG